MTGQGFGVESDAVRDYARATAKDVERIEKIRNRVDRLELPGGVFGRLPQSDELRDSYGEKQSESLKDLRDAADALQDIVDKMKETATSYDRNDDVTAAGFKGY